MKRVEFQLKFSGAYNWLIRNNPYLLDKILPRQVKYYSDKDIILIAKQFKTKMEWADSNWSTYVIAGMRGKGFFLECTKHMVSQVGKYRQKKVKNTDTGKIYDSIIMAGTEFNPGSSNRGCGGNISRAIKNKKRAYGYHWAYCDEKGNVLKK